MLDTLLNRDAVKGRHVRLMFQDEARFGRMVRIRRGWAPSPQRPMVDNGYEREFQSVYGAVSPLAGARDWMLCPAMNTEHRGAFLAHVSAAHPQDFIVMVVDGASSHVAKALSYRRISAYTACRVIHHNSIPRNICGMSCGKRNFRTGCSQICPGWCEPWPPACHGWLRIEIACAWPWIVSSP